MRGEQVEARQRRAEGSERITPKYFVARCFIVCSSLMYFSFLLSPLCSFSLPLLLSPLPFLPLSSSSSLLPLQDSLPSTPPKSPLMPLATPAISQTVCAIFLFFAFFAFFAHFFSRLMAVLSFCVSFSSFCFFLFSPPSPLFCFSFSALRSHTRPLSALSLTLTHNTQISLESKPDSSASSVVGGGVGAVGGVGAPATTAANEHQVLASFFNSLIQKDRNPLGRKPLTDFKTPGASSSPLTSSSASSSSGLCVCHVMWDECERVE